MEVRIMRRNALWLAACAGVFVLAVLLVRGFEAKPRGGISGTPIVQPTPAPVVPVASVPAPAPSADGNAATLAETALPEVLTSTKLDLALSSPATLPPTSEPI